MATQRLSPTGNLLRNSRLFSLPPPLARPTDKITSTRRYDSETATLPYPTQQALETTPASLARGDWGLKRSLPLKSTARTSTPTIRIRDIDSINHITDFDSAADHVLNLRKWQEIGLPVSRTETKKNKYQGVRSHQSVFEPEYDNTEGASSNPAHERWKYRGPWIAGQTAGEFKDYTEQNVKKRRSAFRRFLRERLEKKIAAADRRAALDSGRPVSDQTSQVDEHQLDLHIKELRQDHHRLFELIEEFLDLPSAPWSFPSASEEARVGSWRAEQGPPTTHPSAGLSYLRASGHTFNHPALGPQVQERPVRARVLAVKDAMTGKAAFGVGGIVMETLNLNDLSRIAGTGRPRDKMAFDQDIPGGAKTWIHPAELKVDSQGRIKVHAERADSKTVALYESSEQGNEEQSEEQMRDPLTSASRRIPPLSNLKTGVGRRDSSTGRPPLGNNRPMPDITLNKFLEDE